MTANFDEQGRIDFQMPKSMSKVYQEMMLIFIDNMSHCELMHLHALLEGKHRLSIMQTKDQQNNNHGVNKLNSTSVTG
jgi:hypothetical protein